MLEECEDKVADLAGHPSLPARCGSPTVVQSRSAFVPPSHHQMEVLGVAVRSVA